MSFMEETRLYGHVIEATARPVLRTPTILTNLTFDTFLFLVTVGDQGFTIHTDIGQLGAVMYEVVTGERCEFDLSKNEDLSDSGRAVWPRRGDLPGVQSVWLGWVMDKCWREGAFEMHMN